MISLLRALVAIAAKVLEKVSVHFYKIPQKVFYENEQILSLKFKTFLNIIDYRKADS